jgi:formiminotetrahydrofolate cyclodeaminase
MRFGNLAVAEFAAALGERSPSPASGSATAVTAALAAGLAELTARFAGDEPAFSEAVHLRARLLALADEDAAAYTEFMESRSDEARERTIDVPLEIAERAADVARLGARLAGSARGSVAGDAEVAVLLARGAVAAAARLVELNLRRSGDRRLERVRELVEKT